MHTNYLLMKKKFKKLKAPEISYILRALLKSNREVQPVYFLRK
jgi:hypothetical protein